MCRNLDMIDLVGVTECNLSRRRCQCQHAGGVLIGSRRTDAVFLFTITQVDDLLHYALRFNFIMMMSSLRTINMREVEFRFHSADFA